MATNKNATVRYQALDRCFRNPGRKYYIQDLIDVCNEALLDLNPDSTGVARRQVYEDIKFMKDSQGYSAPIESYKDGRKTYIRYSDTNFSINNQPLNELEAQQLQESLMTLSRFKGMPHFEWVEEISARLESTFKLSSETDTVISFDQNQYFTGLKHISTLYSSIVNRQTLEVSYKNYKQDKPQIFILSPYYLKQFNNRWFLFGKTSGYDTISNLALDRIEAIQDSNQPYEASSVDFEEHFEDIIGVTIPTDAETETVLLEVNNSRYPYIESKPLHGSQRVFERKEDTTVLELNLKVNKELEALLLSYGADITVVSPDWFRNQMKEKAKAFYNNYL